MRFKYTVAYSKCTLILLVLAFVQLYIFATLCFNGSLITVSTLLKAVFYFSHFKQNAISAKSVITSIVMQLHLHCISKNAIHSEKR